MGIDDDSVWGCILILGIILLIKVVISEIRYVGRQWTISTLDLLIGGGIVLVVLSVKIGLRFSRLTIRG